MEWDMMRATNDLLIVAYNKKVNEYRKYLNAYDKARELYYEEDR